MTDTTTDELVERLRDLLGKATPGPWQATYEEGTKLRDEHGDLLGWLSHTHLRGRRPSNEVNANAALIAELRNAAPALLDTIAALKSENRELLDVLEKQDTRIEALEGALREIANKPRSAVPPYDIARRALGASR